MSHGSSHVRHHNDKVLHCHYTGTEEEDQLSNRERRKDAGRTIKLMGTWDAIKSVKSNLQQKPGLNYAM